MKPHLLSLKGLPKGLYSLIIRRETVGVKVVIVSDGGQTGVDGSASTDTTTDADQPITTSVSF